MEEDSGPTKIGQLEWPDILVIIAYFVVVIGVGIWVSFNNFLHLYRSAGAPIILSRGGCTNIDIDRYTHLQHNPSYGV